MHICRGSLEIHFYNDSDSVYFYIDSNPMHFYNDSDRIYMHIIYIYAHYIYIIYTLPWVEPRKEYLKKPFFNESYEAVNWNSFASLTHSFSLSHFICFLPSPINSVQTRLFLKVSTNQYFNIINQSEKEQIPNEIRHSNATKIPM